MDLPFIKISQACSTTTSTPLTSMSSELGTHDTVRAKYHAKDVREFAQALEIAANRALPNHERTRYKEVQALLLRWEEDELDIKSELDDLAKVFQDYGFKTETWLIPTEAPLRKMMGKAVKFVEEHESEDTLFIVYYGGHANINPARQATWSCKRNLNYSSFEWGGCQGLFEQSKSDTLLLLDCCAAAAAAASMPCRPNSITETIAACGWETWAPEPGRYSFTNALIDVLEDWLGRRAFSAAMLHCEVLSVLKQSRPRKNREISKTPVYIVNTSNPKAHSIEITRQRYSAPLLGDLKTKLPESANGSPSSLLSSAPTVNYDKFDLPSLTATLPDKTFVLPHVIMSIALEEYQMLDMDAFACWLKDFPALASYAKIQGVYHSFSTLVILSVPVVIWNVLPDHPAWNFVGYATSDNLFASSSLETSTTDWQVSRQCTSPKLDTASVCTAVGSDVESVGPLKNRLDETTPITSVLQSMPISIVRHSSTKTSALPPPTTKPASYNPLGGNDEYRDFSENSWYPEFSREIRHSRTLVDIRNEEFDSVEDSLEIFFSASENIDSPFEVKELKDFCWGNSLADVIAGKGPAGLERIAWIDDRNSGPGLEDSKDAREYRNPLTAAGLFRALKEPRFNHEHLPDAARRLIYVTDLSPACIYALIATASWLQAFALRDAISKHLAFQSSITAKTPSNGIAKFQLDLHLPFFILDKSLPRKEPLGKAYKRPQRRWTDLSFLKLERYESQREIQEPGEVWGIQEAQISCVVTGTDNWRWIAYGFIDAEIDGVLADSTFEDLSFDLVAAGKLEVNTPIRSPQEYWIKVFEIRIDYVRKQWLYLERLLERSVDQYIKEHSPALSSDSWTQRERAKQVRANFDWARQIIDILSPLHGVLSDTVASWKSFGEDIGYFLGESKNAQNSLCRIRSTFRELQGYEKRLGLLQSRCTEFSKALELRLHLEVKEAAVENRVTSELSVIVLYPIALVASVFSMKQDTIPFETSPRAFAVAVFLLIVIMYAIRLIGRHAPPYPPLFRKRAVLWVKRALAGDGYNQLSDNV